MISMTLLGTRLLLTNNFSLHWLESDIDMRSRLGLCLALEIEETCASLEDLTGDFLGGTRKDLIK